MLNFSNNDVGNIAPLTLSVHFIATGLVRAHKQAERAGALGIPYTKELQNGLNRVLLASLRSGACFPKSVPELIARCHLPLGAWHLPWPPDDVIAHETLLQHGTPTQFCEEMACLMPDVEADITERKFMEAVMDLCKEKNAQDTYEAFRRLCIEHPAITNRDLLDIFSLPPLSLLYDKVEAMYEPVPAALIAADGTICTCAHCGNVLVPLQDGTFRCDESDCDTGNGTIVGNTYTQRDGAMRLKRGLRMFVSAPGRAELSLARTLEKKGVTVTLWPGFDRYDLHLKFPDKTIWAVDVKDWKSPYLLARKLGPRVSLPTLPPWQLGFYVFPNRHFHQQSDYVRVIKGRCQFYGNVTPCFEKDFMRRVNAKLKESNHA